MIAAERRNDSSVKIKTRVDGTFRERLICMLLRFGDTSSRGEGPCQCVVRENISPVSQFLFSQMNCPFDVAVMGCEVER